MYYSHISYSIISSFVTKVGILK